MTQEWKDVYLHRYFYAVMMPICGHLQRGSWPDTPCAFQQFISKRRSLMSKTYNNTLMVGRPRLPTDVHTCLWVIHYMLHKGGNLEVPRTLRHMWRRDSGRSTLLAICQDGPKRAANAKRWWVPSYTRPDAPFGLFSQRNEVCGGKWGPRSTHDTARVCLCLGFNKQS